MLPSPFTFSQSSLQDYSDCPRRFRLRYLERLAWPTLEAEPALEHERYQEEGLRFHRLARQHLLGLPVENLTPQANTPNLARWWEDFLRFARDLGGLADPRSTILRPEHVLAAPLNGHRLIARYDLLAVRPGERAIIFDWKTYRKKPPRERLAARWQTRLYRALLVQAGAFLNDGTPFEPEQIEMVYWFANFPEELARFTYDAARFARDWDLLTRLVGEIAAASDFPLTEDEAHCRFCTYRSYCNRGARAASWDEAPLEGQEESDFDINFEQIAEIEF